MPILSCHWKKLGQTTNEMFKNQMLRLPCPGLLSGHRANFDACADKISTFLLFQKEVMGYRMMATQIRPTPCPPPPPPPPMDIALQHGCRNVTCSISLHLDLLFLISALLHDKTGCHALWGRGGGWAKACDVILNK